VTHPHECSAAALYPVAKKQSSSSGYRDLYSQMTVPATLVADGFIKQCEHIQKDAPDRNMGTNIWKLIPPFARRRTITNYALLHHLNHCSSGTYSKQYHVLWVLAPRCCKMDKWVWMLDGELKVNRAPHFLTNSGVQARNISDNLCCGRYHRDPESRYFISHRRTNAKLDTQGKGMNSRSERLIDCSHGLTVVHAC
jgi:hypothetical protein